jgi:malate dehydrogenase
MVEAILLDRRQILTCAIRMVGEYGIHGVVTGMPVKLGAAGVVEVVEVELTPAEREELGRSADSIRELVAVLG